ncbi:zinc finger protein 335 [Bombina bombina]|uniref:zinc finger protein 335 n=1 Tax=Bombina bombina TaxID=8345 RepID=UPI00235A8075|nr:zinc finger protein 335 [Bombina bombina]
MDIEVRIMEEAVSDTLLESICEKNSDQPNQLDSPNQLNTSKITNTDAVNIRQSPDITGSEICMTLSSYKVGSETTMKLDGQAEEEKDVKQSVVDLGCVEAKTRQSIEKFGTLGVEITHSPQEISTEEKSHICDKNMNTQVSCTQGSHIKNSHELDKCHDQESYNTDIGQLGVRQKDKDNKGSQELGIKQNPPKYSIEKQELSTVQDHITCTQDQDSGQSSEKTVTQNPVHETEFIQGTSSTDNHGLVLKMSTGSMTQTLHKQSTKGTDIKESSESDTALDKKQSSNNKDIYDPPMRQMPDTCCVDSAMEQNINNSSTKDPSIIKIAENYYNHHSTTSQSSDISIENLSIMCTQDLTLKQSPDSITTQDLKLEKRLDNESTEYSALKQSFENLGTHKQSIRQSPDNIGTNNPAVRQSPEEIHSHDLVTRQCSDIIETQDPMRQSIDILVTQESDLEQSGDAMGSQHQAMTQSQNNMVTQDLEIRSNLEIIQIYKRGISSNMDNVDVKEWATSTCTNIIDTNKQELGMEPSMDHNSPRNSDVITHCSEQVTSSCSVPGVCSVFQSYSQAPRPILLHSDPSVDRILQNSICPQIIQGCYVTNTDGRNPEVAQYLILQDSGGCLPGVNPVILREMASSRDSTGDSLEVYDAESLEGMVEVVIVQHYKCKMCQYKSGSKSTLLRHIRDRHILTGGKDEKKDRGCKLARARDEDEEEEEDDIVDAGAIDDPDGDSDYSPGEDVNHGQVLSSPPGTLAIERSRRKPGRPRKIPRIHGPELNYTSPPPLSNDSQNDLGISQSDLENKDPHCDLENQVSSNPNPDELKIQNRPRGRPPKHFRGKKYRRYGGRRYYKPSTKRLLRPFLCRVCGSRFLTHEDFTFHVSSHDGSSQHFRCQQCNYQCRRWSSLKEHMFNHKGNKPHKCEECDYTSVYKKDVIRHSTVHNRERKKKPDQPAKANTYPCPVCNRVYNMQKRLTQHMKTHSTEKPHMCDKCGKAFKKRYTFKMHLLTHLQSVGNSRYKCEFCDHTCEDRKQLLNHQFTHMNDKPFKCDQCKYTTFRQDFLLAHQAIKHTGGKPFACDYCHFTTKHKKNLRLHIQCRHADIYEEWIQRHPEEPPCRRRPFSLQQIEELKQQHGQLESQTNLSEEVQDISAQDPTGDLTYMMQQTTQNPGEQQSRNPLGAATVIYEQDGGLTTQAALDLLLNMSAQREGPGGSLQVAVVKSGSCEEVQESEGSAQEPNMAQVLTLHMDERDVTDVPLTVYEESSEGTVQQITINAAFSTAGYSLISPENIQASLISDTDVQSRSPQALLEETLKDKSNLQVLHKPQVQVAPSATSTPPAAKKFSCKVCGAAFWGRAEMESHKRAHIVDGSGFKCPDCPFSATAWPEVRDHMSLHSNLRPHRCNQCSFASRNKKDLGRHALTHTNHRPHACHMCGQRFNRKGHLKFHIQRLHGCGGREQPESGDLSSAPAVEQEHIFLTQEETVANQEDTAYIQEITTADGQTLQQLVTADNQVQYIISEEGIPHLIPQQYVVIPEGHHIQVQDGQITHIQYEPGAPFLQDQQIHFVPMSPAPQILTQEQIQIAAHSAVTAVADAAMAQTVFSTEVESSMQPDLEYDVITLGD